MLSGGLYSFAYLALLHPLGVKPKSVIRLTFTIYPAFFKSVYVISAFLSASCLRPYLAVAERHSLDAFLTFASDATNLLETNTNLP